MLPPAFTGSGASAPEIASAGDEVTVVVVAVPAAGLVWALSMLPAPLVMTVALASGLATRTTSCTDPLAPAATVPMDQDTVLPESAPPAVAETNVVFAGTPVVSTTLVAFALPPLL